VATYGDGQAHSFNGQTAEDKGGARRGRGKQDDCGDAEQKTGWHNQQSGVFHGPTFQRSMNSGQ
jgi:hypothetical protein